MKQKLSPKFSCVRNELSSEFWQEKLCVTFWDQRFTHAELWNRYQRFMNDVLKAGFLWRCDLSPKWLSIKSTLYYDHYPWILFKLNVIKWRLPVEMLYNLNIKLYTLSPVRWDYCQLKWTFWQFYLLRRTLTFEKDTVDNKTGDGNLIKFSRTDK